MNIRPIEQRDLEPCGAVFLTVFNQPPWNEAWPVSAARGRIDELFNTPGFYGVSAADDTALLGFAMGYVEQWDRGKHFYLKEMCVTPERQRSGIGTVLIQVLCRDLVSMQIERLYLLTARESPAAQFYQRNGFYVSQRMVMMGRQLQENG